MKKEFTIEFEMNTSPQLIFSFVDTSDGLQEWFADKVTQNNHFYIFIWDQSQEIAIKMESKKNEWVKYAWVENENEDINNIDPEAIIKFAIIQHELTGDVSLMISFFEEEDEFENEKVVWEHQIQKLKRTMGL
jgi:uncharacterized protein YndB with AHSA1/START domain